jgi:hypothetical protein
VRTPHVEQVTHPKVQRQPLGQHDHPGHLALGPARQGP